ncbi:hypothetical protein [Nocardia fusca]|nr:hypothetical protein [Nocardia fusca]
MIAVCAVDVDLAAVPRGPASEVVPGAVIEVVPPAAAGKRD